MIEPTDLCNLKCTICYLQNTKLKREKHRMFFGEFKKIVDDIQSHCIYISLFYAGESLLNRDVYDMVEYSNRNNIITSISTNAMLMNEESCRNLITSGLDRLIISFDGATKKSYEKIRKGAKWETVINNIKTMIRLRKELKSKKPFVSLQMVVTKDNEYEIELFKKLADDLNVDEAYAKSLYTYPTGSDKFFKKIVKLNPSKKYRRKVISMRENCTALWRPLVTCSGDVYPCCYDEDSRYPMGNTNEDSFWNIWWSEKYQNFRNDKEKFTKSPMCSKCGYMEDYTIKYF